MKGTSSFQLRLSPGDGAPSSWERPRTTGLFCGTPKRRAPQRSDSRSGAQLGGRRATGWLCVGRAQGPGGHAAGAQASPLASPGVSEPGRRRSGAPSADPAARSGRTKATAPPSPYGGTRRLHGSLTRASQPRPCPERVRGGRRPPNPFGCPRRHPSPPQAPGVAAGGGGVPASGARTSLSCEGLPPTPANPRPPPAPHPQAPPNTPATGSLPPPEPPGTGCPLRSPAGRGARRAPHSRRGKAGRSARSSPPRPETRSFHSASPPGLQSFVTFFLKAPGPTAFVAACVGAAHSRSQFPRGRNLPGGPLGSLR